MSGKGKQVSPIKVGDPIILTDNSGFEDTDLKAGTKGWANAVTTVPGDQGGTFVFFMPVDGKQQYVTFIEHVEFDEERAGLELNESTIHKE